MNSKFELEQFSEEEKKMHMQNRFNSFFHKGARKPDIVIDVNIVNKLPQVSNAEKLFITNHFQDGKENWRLLKKGKEYIYISAVEDKRQLMKIESTFDKVAAYLLPKNEKSAVIKDKRELIRKKKGMFWDPSDIVYDFLQVLMISYFAQRNEGIFIHSVGIKDLDKKGYIFAGRSGCGKSTMARLWDKHTKAMVLNDDRIIVRKSNGKFIAYGSPWHGEFGDYLESRIEAAPVKRIHFIYHARENKYEELSGKKAFNLLYPALFPTFWDKHGIMNISSFAQDLILKIPSVSMGFVKNKKIVDYIRKIDKVKT